MLMGEGLTSLEGEMEGSTLHQMCGGGKCNSTSNDEHNMKKIK
jgi:hypothetical protein